MYGGTPSFAANSRRSSRNRSNNISSHSISPARSLRIRFSRLFGLATTGRVNSSGSLLRSHSRPSGVNSTTLIRPEVNCARPSRINSRPIAFHSSRPNSSPIPWVET